LGKWYVGGKPLRRGYLENAAPFDGGGAGDKPVKLTRSGTGREISGDVDRFFQDPDGKPRPGFGIGLTPPTMIGSPPKRSIRSRSVVHAFAPRCKCLGKLLSY
jgi:hypothetical protein